jgi:hypothetical protein
LLVVFDLMVVAVENYSLSSLNVLVRSIEWPMIKSIYDIV